MAAVADAGSMDINTAIQEVLRLLLSMMVLLVAFMKQPNLSIRGKLFCVFLQKTVTRKNTKNLFKLSAKSIKYPSLRLIPTSNWVNGQAFANLTKMVKLA